MRVTVRGAQVIYETDDDNELRGGAIPVLGEAKFLMYNTTDSVVNPYVHFGQRSLWPR